MGTSRAKMPNDGYDSSSKKIDTILIEQALKPFYLTNGDSCELKPFGSEIEKDLYREILKYISPDVVVANQVDYNTPNGNYRVDFLLTHGGRKVVLEANGKEFHDEITDIYRGAFILGFSDVCSIYYIRGCDITYSLPTVLYAVSRYEPYLFSNRGLKSLEALTEIKEGIGEIIYCAAFCRETGIRNDGSPPDECPFFYKLTLLRKDGKHDKWKRIYKAALDNPGVSAKDFDSAFVKSPHYLAKKGQQAPG